ncbi:HD domain-containing protein [Azospirillum sp. RWY-5-1]|uniref:HD domain-containing protein n=1 Tax=Azospirillum oleiclasticum TaxID=2735135 RepID=A0ABX2T7J6_9PROT|nr:HD domain-containing phosphohydrolase [Azospirillum oleiclasticum]NYZ11968.1 HD domain-containing protein [Azospirillum oleiclasticum]NYZ19128.1 HD domain-containing protein [Azospirillum oleiclasticum]
MERDVFRRLTIRLALASLVIAPVFGGAVWYYELERIDDAVVELATTEARAFAEQHGDALVAGRGVQERLQRFLEERAQERGGRGHFLVVELYDGGHRPIAEASLEQSASVDAAFNRGAHPFPTDGGVQYERLTLDGVLYVRVLSDLHAGPFQGHFEGLYRVAPERKARIEENVLGTVLIVIGVVVGTTLALLPVVVGLNRRLVRMNDRLLRANLEILEVLGCAIAKRDSETGSHNYRVTLYAVRLAETLGCQSESIRALVKGAFLHDVGKIAISDTILLKPGRLTTEEFAVMKTHVQHGTDIVGRSAWLEDATPVVAGHHEKFDGSGYPAGSSGSAIPRNARIFAVVDVFDALTSRRPYKEPMTFQAATTILLDGRGGHFDPDVLDGFLRIACDLHARLGNASEESLRAELLTVIERYF